MGPMKRARQTNNTAPRPEKSHERPRERSQWRERGSAEPPASTAKSHTQDQEAPKTTRQATPTDRAPSGHTKAPRKARPAKEQCGIISSIHCGPFLYFFSYVKKLAY